MNGRRRLSSAARRHLLEHDEGEGRRAVRRKMWKVDENGILIHHGVMARF